MRRRRVGTVAVAVVALLGVLGGVAVLLGGGPTGGSAGSGPPPAGSDAAGSDAARSAAPEIAPGPPEVPADAPTPPEAAGRDVVRTAELTLQVADPGAAGRGVRTAAAAAGGFVAEERSDPTGAWLVLRVPADRLDRLVDDLAATGTVLARSGRVEDATGRVADLDGRVAGRQASVTRVRALLAEATSIGNVLSVEAELAAREADLEALQRRLAALRDRVALSTLTVELRGAAATADDPPPGFGAGLGAGWAGLRVLGTALAAAAGFVLPFLPLPAAVAGLVWAVRRRAGRGRAGRERAGQARARRGDPGPEGGS